MRRCWYSSPPDRPVSDGAHLQGLIEAGEKVARATISLRVHRLYENARAELKAKAKVQDALAAFEQAKVEYLLHEQPPR